jgi:hypothetical protein
MNLAIKIEGLPEAEVKFRLLNETVRRAALIGMKQATMIVQRRAKENISGEHGHTRHVKTGNLRRNIKTKAGWTGTYTIDGVIGTDVPYAPYVESLPDGGFLYPALMEVGTAAHEFFNRVLVLALTGKEMKRPDVIELGGPED